MSNSILRKRKTYSDGELNRLIDAVLHPISKQHPEILILDGLLHGIVERNPAESIQKFIYYNNPKLLAHMIRNKKRRPRSKFLRHAHAE
jgi:hypothetical protein